MPATITYRGQTLPARPGQDLLGALLDAGADVAYLCMSGSCGTCRIRVTSGTDQLEPLTRGEQAHGCMSAEDRLACQAFITGTGKITLVQD
ncbi:hypothetical protein LBMAG53_05930 [Planctomycetota bacterium]|nr:hypothetical protein LBMAG53_05930 [Planctomycetota bacterium]